MRYANQRLVTDYLWYIDSVHYENLGYLFVTIHYENLGYLFATVHYENLSYFAYSVHFMKLRYYILLTCYSIYRDMLALILPAHYFRLVCSIFMVH